MNVTIAGNGYVGLVMGARLAEVASNVVCLNPEEKKIRTSNNGEMPMFEPRLAARMKNCEATDYLTAFERNPVLQSPRSPTTGTRAARQ